MAAGGLAAPPRFTWIAALPPNIDRHFTKTDFAHRKSMNSIPPGLGPSPLALLIALMVLVSAPAAFLTALILSLRPKLQVERILFVCAFTLIIDAVFNLFSLPRGSTSSVFDAICGVGFLLSIVALWRTTELEKRSRD